MHEPSRLWWHYGISARRRYEREELYPLEDTLPSLLVSDDAVNDPAAPPFGWLDGHDHIDCQRWGRNILRATIQQGDTDNSNAQLYWMEQMRSRWCRLGFAFWDRERVEVLKTCLPSFQTGWLARGPPSRNDPQLVGTEMPNTSMCQHAYPAL